MGNFTPINNGAACEGAAPRGGDVGPLIWFPPVARFTFVWRWARWFLLVARDNNFPGLESSLWRTHTQKVPDIRFTRHVTKFLAWTAIG